MTRSLSFGWLRALVTALRRWSGAVTSALGRWQCHRGRMAGGEPFMLCLSPLPPPGPSDSAAVRTELAAARARLVAGTPLAPLAPAVRLGAVIHALLEDGAPERRPALLVVRPPGMPGPPGV